MNTIPKQLENLDLSPISKTSKAGWSLNKNQLTELQIQAADENDAWSKKGKFLSWPRFNRLPRNIVDEILKDYNIFGLHTGKQNGTTAYIVVLDIDNDNKNAKELLEMVFEYLPRTFTRRTPSGGFHVYYHLPSGTMKTTFIGDRKRLDFHTRDLPFEVHNGSFIAEIGANRTTVIDERIQLVSVEDLRHGIEDFLVGNGLEKKIVQDDEPLKDYQEPVNPVNIEWTEMENILNKYYLPVYIQPELNTKRDTIVLFGTMGVLRRYYNQEICQNVLDWLNNIAEYRKKEGEPNTRSYDWNTTDKVGIPTMVELGFKDFIDAIVPTAVEEPLNPADGELFLKRSTIPLARAITEIFEVLFPGNGSKAALLWASAIQTARGNPQMAVIKGNPGEGKTVLMEYILDFIPSKYIYKINEVTAPGLFGIAEQHGEYCFDKKIVYLGDLGDKRGFENSIEARKILRTLQTDSYYKKVKTEKVDVKGSKVAVQQNKDLILRGNPAQWYTTVREDADAQDNDRSIITTTDLRLEEQVKYIIQHIGKNSRTGRKIKAHLEYYIPILQSIFEYLVLSKTEAIVPYNLSKMKYRFRDTSRIKDITEMIAAINQESNKLYRDIYIVASKTDLSDALLFLDEGSGELNQIVLKRLNIIWNKFKYSNFTRIDVQLMFPDSFSQPAVAFKQVIKPGIDAGFIEEAEAEGRAIQYHFIDEPKHQYTVNIPDPDWEMVEDEYGELTDDYTFRDTLFKGEI